jgi:hypothetical protein
MSDPLSIVSILGRTDEGNGVSRPFICEGADGHIYYVKHKNAGYTELVKEWVAGRLAQCLGLPIPEFRVVKIDRALVRNVREWELELGAGAAFGSRKLADSLDLRMEQASQDSGNNQGRVLLFDRWIRNEDRKLTTIGGNSNCLWDPGGRRIVLIDHDNAFDPSFSGKEFWSSHAFRRYTDCFAAARRAEQQRWLDSGLARLPEIWGELPAEWLHDEFGDRRSVLDMESIRRLLSMPGTPEEDFWSLPSPPP